MKLKNIYLLACTAFLFSAASCNDDNDTESSVGGKVAVDVAAGFAAKSDPTTYASDGTWTKDDIIGLTMLNNEGKEIVDKNFNFMYITPTGSTSFIPRSPENTAYFPQNGSGVKIKAYYPYSATLTTDMKIPLSVVDQNTLPRIDFMSADHLDGFSKADPSVQLNFHHRLSKLIFNLSITDDDKTIPLKDFELTIKGMKTTANYDLFAEVLNVDAASAKNIIVPSRGKDTERNGIVLPRAAADGITFEFKAPNGNNYTAKMSSSLALQAGYKYTFNIKLQKTPVTVSATVEDWIEGPTSNYGALDVSTPAGESSGVKAGDIMNVYMKGETDYALLKPFKFNADGKWYADTPVYWEDIKSPADFRASIISAPALNSTQLADILIADEISVPRNTGADFVLKHAASKVFVKLTSTTFSATDLGNATIILPNYQTGGKEQLGTFVPGTQTANVNVDRKDKDNSVALFQPQTIAKGNTILKVTMNGRDYLATATAADLAFKAGEAQVLIVKIDKTSTSVSAKVVDWTMEQKDLDAITVGTATSGAEGVLNGEEMVVYTGNATDRTELTTFTYNLGANTWAPATPVYWESLPSPSTFYASILRAAKYNNTQLDDYLIARPTSIMASNGVKFELSHAAAKVTIQLTSSDGSFDATDLEAMNITLPNYANGAIVNDAVFVPGTGKGDVTIAKNVGDDGKSAIAIIQAQTISSGSTVANIVDPSSSRTYTVSSTSAIQYKAGVATLLKIDLKKTAVSVSANVIDWEIGNTINLVPKAIIIGGTLDSTSDFFKNKKIEIYKHSPNFAALTYSYFPVASGFAWTGAPIYWDGQTFPLKMTAMHYPSDDLKPSVSSESTQFTWNLPADQSKGYSKYDVLTNFLSIASPQYINFKFTHAMSKVRVEVSSDEFTSAQLVGAKVGLKNFILDGSVKVVDGKAVAATAKKDVTAFADTDGSKYSALVMPQSIAANTPIVMVTLPDYPNTPFYGELSSPLNFVGGKETVIKLKLKKTTIELSATLEPWTPGETGNIIIQ